MINKCQRVTLMPWALPDVPSKHFTCKSAKETVNAIIVLALLHNLNMKMSSILYQSDISPEHKRPIITKQRRAEPESEHIYGRVGNVEGFSDIAAELLRIHTAETLQSQVHCTFIRQVHQQILSWRNTRWTNDHVRSSMTSSLWHQIKRGNVKEQRTNLWWLRKPHFLVENESALKIQGGSRRHLPPSNPENNHKYWFGNTKPFYCYILYKLSTKIRKSHNLANSFHS